MHPFFTPWKHQKTLPFSDIFREKRKGALGTNRLINASFQKLLREGYDSYNFAASRESVSKN